MTREARASRPCNRTVPAMRSTSSSTRRSPKARRHRLRPRHPLRVRRATRCSVDPSVTFSEPVVASSRVVHREGRGGNSVAGTASFNSADTVDTFTPTSALAAGTTYTVTVSGATDQFGQTMTTDTYTFTTSKAFDSGGQCPCAIWPDVAPSGATDATDTSSVKLGVQFQPTAERDRQRDPVLQGAGQHRHPHRHPVDRQRHPAGHGHVHQRVHPGLGGTGLLHPGDGHGRHHLCGVVPHDHGSLRGHLGRAQLGGDQRAADRAGQRRGLRLRLVHHLPVQQLRRVELLGRRGITRPPAAPSVSSSTPVAGSSSNPVSVDPSVTFSEPVVPSSASFTVKDASGNTVPGSASFNSADTVDTFTPTSALAAGTTYTVTVSGAQNSSGQTMTTDTYTFTTSKAFDAGGQCPCAIWPDAAPSGATDATDTSCGEPGRSVPGHGRTGPSAGSGSTRSRTTPAPTPAPCGPPAAPSWPRARSPTSPPRAGRSWTSPPR